MAFTEAVDHVRDGIETFFYVVLGPDEHLIGNLRGGLDQLDRLVNVIDRERLIPSFSVRGLLPPRKCGHCRHQLAWIDGLCEMQLETAPQRLGAIL